MERKKAKREMDQADRRIREARQMETQGFTSRDLRQARMDDERERREESSARPSNTGSSSSASGAASSNVPPPPPAQTYPRNPRAGFREERDYDQPRPTRRCSWWSQRRRTRRCGAMYI